MTLSFVAADRALRESGDLARELLGSLERVIARNDLVEVTHVVRGHCLCCSPWPAALVS
jgi:hypothetical protein